MLYLGPNYPRKVGQIAIHNFITSLPKLQNRSSLPQIANY